MTGCRDKHEEFFVGSCDGANVQIRHPVRGAFVFLTGDRGLRSSDSLTARLLSVIPSGDLKLRLPLVVEEAGGGDSAGSSRGYGFCDVDDGVVGEFGDLAGVV